MNLEFKLKLRRFTPLRGEVHSIKEVHTIKRGGSLHKGGSHHSEGRFTPLRDEQNVQKTLILSGIHALRSCGLLGYVNLWGK